MHKGVVIGAGYVGLSMVALLARRCAITVIDVDERKINMLVNDECPIAEDELAEALINNKSRIEYSSYSPDAITQAEFIVIAVPTDYDSDTDFFNTRIVESVISNAITLNPDVLIVIKSTVPVGFTTGLCAKLGKENIIFSPEFLREGHSLSDNLHPSRIVVGGVDARKGAFARMLASCAEKKGVEVIDTGSTEAEAIKLFSNTYLAMRVGFFNEIDNYALAEGLDMRALLKGMGLDPRIGMHYMNPSFGYGGYCLPKDTKQAVANFKGIPNKLINAIVESNQVRKQQIVRLVCSRLPKVVGVYKLAMKAGSDNFRSAAVLDIMEQLQHKGVEVIVYEPSIVTSEINGCVVHANKAEFFDASDVIIANRHSPELSAVVDKVICRDVFQTDE